MAAISSVDYVKWVQHSLNRFFGQKHGGLIVVNGSPNDLYRTKVREFQKLAQMTSNGNVDELTQDWLIRANHYSSLYMSWAQWVLQKHGFLTSANPGEERTRLAIRRFQARNKLKVDGWIGAKTELAMRQKSGVEPPGGYGGAQIPNGGPIQMPTPIPKEKDSDLDRGYEYGPAQTWFAVGGKASVSTGSSGKEKMYLALVPLEDPIGICVCSAYTEKKMIDIGNGTEIGGGLGASAGITAGFVYGLQHPYQLEGLASGGIDASLSIGVNLGWTVKLMAQSGKIGQIASNVAGSAGGWLARNEKNVEQTFLAVRNAGQYAQSELSRDRIKPLLFDVPGASAGFEVGLFAGNTTFQLHWKKIWGEDPWLGEEIGD